MINFSLANPSMLLLLLLIPCLIWCKLKSKIYYFSKPEWLPKRTFISDNTTIWLIAIYSLIVISLSSPYSYDAETSSNRKGRDLILALDTSGSMAERGFNRESVNQTRYNISISLAKDFIKNRHDDNIGLVVFGSFAFTASPLTYDLSALEEMFDLTSSVGIAGTSTAIGDAIWQSIITLNAGEAKSKVIILLTDGKHNAGVHSPREAVNEARRRGIKIYTIGIGKKGEYDKELLSTIAKDSKGESFFASNSRELKKIYKKIDKLEPSPIRSNEYLNKQKLFIYPLLLATLLIFILILRDEERI